MTIWMVSKIVLRRSARDSILWHFHVLLDSVPEGKAGQGEFVEKILTQFGVAEHRREKLVARICESLPDDLHDVDMTDVMRTFENVLPIEWDDDLIAVGKDSAAEFERAVLRILERRTPAQLPKEVTSLLIQELTQIVGPALDQSLLPRISEAIENLLVSNLWRTKDDAARERLTRRLLYSLKDTARLEFGGEPKPD